MMQTQQEQLTAREFFDWFLKTFKIVESKQLETIEEYSAALPKNCDFFHLKEFLENTWRTIRAPRPAIPSTQYLLYNCRVTHLMEPAPKCKAVLEAEKNRKEHLENWDEYEKAKKAFFDAYFKKYDRRKNGTA